MEKHNISNHSTPMKPQTSNKLDLYSVDEGFVKGNLFRNLYQGYQGYEPKIEAPMNLEQAMMHEIQKYAFAAHDLNLYLDNNPDDRRAIELYNQYQMKVQEAINNYENQFGPIQVSSPKLNTYPWGWLKTKWPWEGTR